MIFEQLDIPGSFLIRPERHADERGFFARTFCVRELAHQGLDPQVVQRSVSYNRRAGTLRGLHFQAKPFEENKQITCIRGSIYDVIVDLRSDSPRRGRWLAATLTADDPSTLYIPKGCAHGFLTLVDDTIVQYDISEFYEPQAARGIRYDDPAFRIRWPSTPTVISARDSAFSPYASAEARPPDEHA